MADDIIYIGEIRMYGGSQAPAGWAFCNGAQIATSDNPELYSLIGDTYGGDQTYFNLPDLQGRVPYGLGGTYNLGDSGGLETVTLTPDNMPAHTHPVIAASSGGSDDPEGNSWGTSTGVNVYADVSTADLTMNPDSITTAGGGLAHDNMIPFQVVSYIIALQGVYPSKG
ncbi:phage tail protein [Puia dinghuensis]|uniref:Tail Collar domain-containing protein n=1 Tax=Puia dinghuensis TaxID=1792502 RepID=A0A8J2UIM7_9BACT|nr:tail fiber protein [Puia dinghuensis]GGB23024.1 tail Collar domain-containing protein [Puia dinghuensis]